MLPQVLFHLWLGRRCCKRCSKPVQLLSRKRPKYLLQHLLAEPGSSHLGSILAGTCLFRQHSNYLLLFAFPDLLLSSSPAVAYTPSYSHCGRPTPCQCSSVSQRSSTFRSPPRITAAQDWQLSCTNSGTAHTHSRG